MSRKHNVEQNHIVMIGFRQRKRFLSVICGVDLHIILFQAELDALHD